jgi:hypothetical protein
MSLTFDSRRSWRRRESLRPPSTKTEQPGHPPDTEDAYTAILLTLDQFPEARAAVVRAIRRLMGEPEEPET